jgi:tetratricopeptide (TPR) repeat protein
MTPERWARIKALFSEALEVPAAERAAFLALHEDTDLVSEVRSLLDSHERPGEFSDSVSQGFRSTAFAESAATRSRIGERIGAYRIVSVLGTGGMGDVFRAVRDDDQYRAEVAIKLMRADVRSTLTEQRFRTERQILAGLDHRNIARLLDGGTSVNGMPYVVMELVSGAPIDTYCDARNLDVRERVRLFLQICAAVSYAHQHLIVHRDLKPNNILVTTDGSVKLLDFGIAKLLEPEVDTVQAGDGTVTTLLAMTLDYASPEQVVGGPVTTVSDVYSLGVVLYRLLTGQSPYGARTNDAQRIAEILSDTTPTRPSQVQRKIDGDLDNILLMALRKEPQRRYGSVEQFANDLRNYLAGMPVHARGNSLGYRSGKFLRRRKVEVAAGFVALCALVGVLGVAVREAHIAEQQRRVAQQHFDSVRKLANTLMFGIHDEMAKVSGSTRTREMLVSTSLEYLDTLYKQAGSDHRLQEELATAYIKVAQIQGSDDSANRGNFAGALRSYERSIALLTPLMIVEPENHRAGWVLAKAYVEQAALVMVARGPKHAREAAQTGVALTELHAPAISDEADRVLRLGTAYAVYARILGFLGRSAEAMPFLDKFIALREAYWHAHPEDPQAMIGLSIAYNNSAIIADTRLSERASYEKSMALLRKSLSVAQKLVTLQPNEPRYQHRVAAAHFNMGNFLWARGRYAESLELFRLAAPVVVRAAQDSNDSSAQYTMALIESGHARALFKTGNVEEARILFLKCAKVLDGVLERDGSLRTEFALGQNAVRLGELYAHLAENRRESRDAQLGLWKQARESLQRGVASLQKVTANATLEALDAAVLNDGVAALYRANTMIAKLEGQD